MLAYLYGVPEVLAPRLRSVNLQPWLVCCVQAGTKLLWTDVKIATRLLYKAASGRTLTRCADRWHMLLLGCSLSHTGLSYQAEVIKMDR